MVNTTNIVVSRYKRNTVFVYKINNYKNVNVLIYDKEDPTNPLNIPLNKGQEASVYLKYIIDYYDSLPEFTFFIHDEEYSWHHSGSLIDKYQEAVMSNQKYYNVNDKCIWKGNAIKELHGDKMVSDYKLWYSRNIEEYIPFSTLPVDFLAGYRGSAQFLVHKDLIKTLPKKFYENLYNWIIKTPLSNYISSRFLEWSWHIFWCIHPKNINL